jgi:ubiquitin carboxyl-terminal hydrolase L5
VLEWQTDHIKRTHDYEPFFLEFVTCLHREGLLNALLDREKDGKKKKRRLVGDRNEMEK